MKKGLIMEGGAYRGIFTCGVIDVFLENDIVFDGAIGVSAGAVFGCNYKSKQIGRGLRYNKRFMGDKRYAGFRSWIKTGNYFNERFAYKLVPLKYDKWDENEWLNNPMEFYGVCTNVETGGPVYKQFRRKLFDDIDWLRASASMPILSKIVHIDGFELLDGGVADSIPVRYFEEIGYDHNVVILTQPRDYKKEKNKLLPIIRLVYRKYPRFVEAVANRHIRYNETLKYIKNQEKEGNLFVIAPRYPLDISATETDPEELDRVYQEGRTVALKCLEQLKEYLNQ